MMRRLLLTVVVCLALAAPVSAQLVSTTLAADAVTGNTGTTTTFVLTSGTGIQSSFFMLIDQEVVVVTAVSGANVTARRSVGGFNGPHKAGATVYAGLQNFFFPSDPQSPNCIPGSSQNPFMNQVTGQAWVCSAAGLWQSLNTIPPPGAAGTVAVSQGPGLPMSYSSVVLGAYLPLVGGTLTGTVNAGSSVSPTNYTIPSFYINNAGGAGLVIKAGTSGNSRSPIYMQDSGGVFRAALTSGGAFYTQGWFLADGGLTSTLDATGTIATFVQTTLPSDAATFMIGGVSDVAGPTYISKALGTGSAHFLGLDRSANSTFQIGELGQLSWGATTVAAMDLRLMRKDANTLEIDNGVTGTFRDLYVRSLFASTNIVLNTNNGATLQAVDSGGTARNVIALDNANALRFEQLAAGNLIIKPASGNLVKIMNNAESINSLVFYETTSDFSIGANTDSNFRLDVIRSGSAGTFRCYDSTASTGITQCIVREGAGQTTTIPFGVYATNGTTLRFGINNGDIQWGTALVALGGGAAPTVGTIGGSGPATAAQNSWMRVMDSTGAAFWVPAWK